MAALAYISKSAGVDRCWEKLSPYICAGKTRSVLVVWAHTLIGCTDGFDSIPSAEDPVIENNDFIRSTPFFGHVQRYFDVHD